MRIGFLFALLALAPAVWPQKPSDADDAALLERSRQKAVDYARSLPDLICTETIARFASAASFTSAPVMPGVTTRTTGGYSNTAPMSQSTWASIDKLTIRLGYSRNTEEHKLLAIDGKPTDRTYETLDGAVGGGEFGGILKNVFDPESKAVFRWTRWRTVRKRRAAVYQYTIASTHSKYLLGSASIGDLRQAIVGFHGEVEVDAETGETIHVSYEADHIPKELGLDQAITVVDYDFADIGRQRYRLPSHSEFQIRWQQQSTKNDAEFGHYQKFSADSTIQFGTGK